MKRTGCLICLWAAALLTLPEQDLDAAQEGPPLQRKLTVDYRGVSVVEVLKDVGDRTGARFTYADKFLEGLDLVTCEAREQEAGRILTRILMPRGLKLQMDEASLVTVVKRDPCDEFKVRRENVFEFAEKPKVTREGDRVTIAFETRAFCDVTVAIESASTGSGHSEIVRHIASGVLGDNAPEPFQWNSKKQTLSWDGKDDRGAYVDNRDVCFVRVSLGLKPQFERTLFWSPKKRIGFPYPALGVAPEGVYVAESYEVDQVRLFDHQGNYLRTIYPFPADMIDKVQGLKTHTFLQDGKPLDPQLDHDSSCTLVKVPAGKATVISTSGKIPVPLPEQSQPKRPPDLAANCGGVSGWVEGAEWFYGGVGFGAGACVCWNCRFALDYFARSFAPEPLHCSVAVLDSAGNLVLRVGQYGNVEDGKPLIPAGGPANPRAVGGDEVALNYACYVAAHTDRRLFIADAGNARILGVKLGYHAEEKVTLKDVAERNN